MQEEKVDLLRTANAIACAVTTAPSKTEHPSSVFGEVAVIKSKKGGDTGRYFGILVVHGLLVREYTKKMCASRVMKTDVVRFPGTTCKMRCGEDPFRYSPSGLERTKLSVWFRLFFVSVHSVKSLWYARKDK